MTRVLSTFVTARFRCAVCTALFGAAAAGGAKTAPFERTFRESKSTVEKALKQLQGAMSGRLPTVEGFALASGHPLSRYERAFYQCTVQVSSTPSGESVVRVSAKVTAWYAEPGSSQSGYQLLRSNGRIEADLLDQLSDELLRSGVSSPSSTAAGSDVPAAPPAFGKPPLTDEPTVSAPLPDSPGIAVAFSPFARKNSAAPAVNSLQPADAGAAPKVAGDLQAEAASLEEVLRNQAHPKNIVAVKRSGTPVVASPSLSSKILFLASAHDEFEILDYSGDWVHVRISGLSRGWIWRTSLEMPEGIPDVPQMAANTPPAVAELFQVSREETALFPGDWEPLRGKSVRIISVQKVLENEQGAGAPAKLEYAKALFDSRYEQLTKSLELSGLVLIFDSADGGMIAATLATIERWKAGTLNDAGLWHQCYFDPPETFSLSATAGSR